MNNDLIDALRRQLDKGPVDNMIIWLRGQEHGVGAQSPWIEGGALVGCGFAFALDEIVGFRVLEKAE